MNKVEKKTAKVDRRLTNFPCENQLYCLEFLFLLRKKPKEDLIVIIYGQDRMDKDFILFLSFRSTGPEVISSIEYHGVKNTLPSDVMKMFI